MLREENADAVMIWLHTQDQLVYAGMAGVLVGPNQIAVWEAIKQFKIKRPTDCFERVMYIFRYFIERYNSEVRAGNSG